MCCVGDSRLFTKEILQLLIIAADFGGDSYNKYTDINKENTTEYWIFA